jgi:hypothetical protein
MRFAIPLATALVLAGLTVQPLAAQSGSAAGSAAWFGVATPPGLQAPSILSEIKAKDFQAKVKPAGPAQGDGSSPEFSGALMEKDLNTVVDFGLKPKKAGKPFWGRITGYPEATDTANWLAAQFKAAGLQQVAVQTYDANAPYYQQNSWEVRVLADPGFGAGSKDVVLASATPTSGSLIMSSSLAGPIVYAGEAGAPVTIDVRGKIAIQHSKPTTGAYSDRTKLVQSAQALNKAGALAVINWIEQPGNMHVNDFGRCGGVCFNIGGADGAFLKGVMDKAGGKPVNIKVSLDAINRSDLKGQNVIGVVPGASPEALIINAHIDSWFDGAGDNADGVATLVAMARHYGKPGNKPARTLIFVGSGGHHSPGLGGPPNLLKTNAELMSHVLFVMNIEHIAQYQLRSTPVWHVDPTEEPKMIGVSNMAPFLVDTFKTGAARYGYTYDPTITNSVPGDLGGYAPLNVARFQGIHSGPLYHTSGDVVESISIPGMERAARFYTWYIDQIAKASKEQINPPGSNTPPAPARRGGAAD